MLVVFCKCYKVRWHIWKSSTCALSFASNSAELHKKYKQEFVKENMGRNQVLEWVSSVNCGQTLVENTHCSDLLPQNPYKIGHRNCITITEKERMRVRGLGCASRSLREGWNGKLFLLWPFPWRSLLMGVRQIVKHKILERGSQGLFSDTCKTVILPGITYQKPSKGSHKAFFCQFPHSPKLLFINALETWSIEVYKSSINHTESVEK